MAMMNTTPSALTPSQSRTRTAILKAAIQVFTRDRSAPLAEVAREAEVARSTLHRYFPERSDLIAAVGEYARAQSEEVESQCDFSGSITVDAMVQMALEYFERWEAIMWAYMDASESTNHQPEDDVDSGFTRAIQRAQEVGEIDPTISAVWLQQLMFSIVYTSWEFERLGHPHSEAAMMTVAAMRKLLLPGAASVVVPQFDNGSFG